VEEEIIFMNAIEVAIRRDCLEFIRSVEIHCKSMYPIKAGGVVIDCPVASDPIEVRKKIAEFRNEFQRLALETGSGRWVREMRNVMKWKRSSTDEILAAYATEHREGFFPIAIKLALIETALDRKELCVRYDPDE
jgi:hypothetical protein